MGRSMPPLHTSQTQIHKYRLALLPAVLTVSVAELSTALLQGGVDFLEFVIRHDLGPLWHHRLQAGNALGTLPAGYVDALHRARMAAVAGYLPQRAALDQLDKLFAGKGIPYVVIKGVYVRECVYPDPTLRPATDIDVLVLPQDRLAAAKLLIDSGYAVHVTPDNVSHEATFTRGLVDIDLHWHILRPGHTRTDTTTGFIARRQQTHGVWGLSDSDTLFMMLTHPAFSKYVCSPNMGLGRVADFLLWLQQGKAEWSTALQLLQTEGLKTAAWTMLTWLRLLAPPGLTGMLDEWLGIIQPSRLRRAYMRAWVTHDLPTRFLQRPHWIQLGFILWMHDRPGDVLRALHQLGQARLNRLRDARLLLGSDYQWGQLGP